MRYTWIIVPAIFIVNTIIQVMLGWGGSHVSLVSLAVSTIMLAVVLGIYSKGWRDALSGWKRSTAGWSAAQTWAMKQDQIMRDVLNELSEYDEEAYEIHRGRSLNAGTEYLVTLGEEPE